MPTLTEVIDTFKRDKIVELVSRFYDNAMKSKNSGVFNHSGSDEFCQFVKYATSTARVHKRSISEPDLKETKLKGSLGDSLIEITEWVEVPGWILSTDGGYTMQLAIDGEIVAFFEVNKSDYLLRLEAYKKGAWIKQFKFENNQYALSLDTSRKQASSRLSSDANPDKFSI